MKVADLLDAPLYTGSIVTSDVPGVWNVSIGGHGFMIEPSLYQRQTIERFRNPYDVQKEPGEHSAQIQGPWLRSAAKWDHGAGQDFWDQSDSDRDMFRASKGINVWPSTTGQVNQRRAQLLPDTRNIRASANTNLDVLSVNGYLYVSDGNELYWTTGPAVASPSWTASTVNIAEGAQSVASITSDGTVVYAAVGPNGIHKTTLGASVSTHFSAYNPTLIKYTNGRLIAANGNVIVEIDAAGVSTTLMTHRNASFVWTSIEGAPNGIYIGGNGGDRNEMYWIGLKADHSLDAPIYAGDLPFGETLNAMYFYAGAMVLATSIGFRIGTITNANGISFNNAVVISGGVACVEPQGNFVWFAWKNYDASSTGLGRFSLGQFTDPMVPAYASDLMATGQGTVSRIASFASKRYFAVSGLGIFAEYGNLVASGVLYSGWVNYSTTERKTAISIDLRHEPLNGSVAVSLIAENGGTITVGTSASASALSPSSPMTVPTVSSEAFEVVLTLTRSGSDATLGPVLRRWTFRSLVTPHRVDEIHVPIKMNLSLSAPDGEENHLLNYDPLNEWLFLKGLEDSGAPISYQEGTQSYVAYIEQVMLPQDKDRYWTESRSFLQGLVIVRLITLNPAG